ncbi:hypothetical protein AM1_3647 [Acaryochloris marina MBIC11017]|uniref:Uncharacterized protein n=1 Tax=Acaryochloris marina (strain MBIC 11017) TaxID=329726 RepID=B0C3D8_ACAM1|nr:hypothetical protein AM1_3647 [Acaryochloris marina MBIC11017]
MFKVGSWQKIMHNPDQCSNNLGGTASILPSTIGKWNCHHPN